MRITWFVVWICALVLLLMGGVLGWAEEQLTCEQHLALVQKQLAVTRQSRAQLEEQYALLLTKIEAAQKQAPVVKVDEKTVPKVEGKK